MRERCRICNEPSTVCHVTGSDRTWFCDAHDTWKPDDYLSACALPDEAPADTFQRLMDEEDASAITRA